MEGMIEYWFSEICELNWGMHSCLCYYWIPVHLGSLSACNISWKWTSANGLRMMTELGQFQPDIVSHGPFYGKLQDSPAVAAWPSANVMDSRRQDSMLHLTSQESVAVRWIYLAKVSERWLRGLMSLAPYNGRLLSVLLHQFAHSRWFG